MAEKESGGMKRYYSVGVFLNLFNNRIPDWEKQIDFIESLSGVEHVEIWVEVLPITNRQINFLDKRLGKYRLVVHAPFLGVNFLSPNKPIRRAAEAIFRQTNRVSKVLGAELITWHLGKIPEFLKPKQAAANLSNSVLRSILYSSSRSIKQAVENLPTLKGAEASAFPLKTLSRIFPSFSNLPLTLDVGHCIRSGEDPIEMFIKHQNQIANIHLVDVTGDGIDHQQLGTGVFKLNKFLEVLTKYKYSGFVSVEVLGKTAIRNSWKLLRSYISSTPL